MGDTLLGVIIGAVPTGAAALLGWAKWLHELREKNRERGAKEKERGAKERAEAQLREIQRRSTKSTPYLAPSRHKFNGLDWHNPADGKHYWVSAGTRNLLCFLTEVINEEMPEGDEVMLLLENRGSSAQEIEVKMAGQNVEFFSMEDDGVRHPCIAYKYDPAKRGQEQIVEVSFLAENGFRDTHRYLTKHGFRILKRVDPA
jgi:hypothetical protein